MGVLNSVVDILFFLLVSLQPIKKKLFIGCIICVMCLYYFFYRGSVFSALSSAHWALSQLDAAINYMQQDLAVAKSLGDTAGECRAHGNLGAAYFSQGSYKDALTAHRYQLVLAMKCKVSYTSYVIGLFWFDSYVGWPYFGKVSITKF